MDQPTTEFSAFAKTIMEQKYSHTLKDGSKETWENISYRVTKHVMKAVGLTMSDKLSKTIFQFIKDRKFIPGGRYLYAAGRQYHQIQNCLLMRAVDSREGWSELLQKSSMALMTGAGIGVVYSDIRGEGSLIRKTGGTATGPISLAQIINECGRGIMQGGSRRSAIWAGLHWNHPDVHKFIGIKDWSKDIRALKEKDFSFPATLDGTNISVILDDDFFDAYNNQNHFQHDLAKDVYWKTVRQMLKTAEPGFSIDIGKNSGENNRNACNEVCSADDSDVCNLASINLARINSLDEMEQVMQAAVVLLLAGTVYSDVPYPKVDEVRTKNRRLGLGLMGLHEWLLMHGSVYGVSKELSKYLEVYSNSTRVSHKIAKEWKLSLPVKTRAVAPVGSIGILAETSTGVEPIFCVAYKRRYLDKKDWKYQYVVDPTAKRLIESGISPDLVEDAYSIDLERRLEFQSFVQEYVDHGISSTINLPEWGSERNNEKTLEENGNTIMKYLPRLRGLTCYPDGARGGQPLSRIKYDTAFKHEGDIFVEQADICDITMKGSCGA